MTPGIVVTGGGFVGAAGCGREVLPPVLAGRVPAPRPVDGSGAYQGSRSARTAALVDAGVLQGWLPPVQARRMSPPSRFAVAAARMALDEAGLAAGEYVDGPTDVVLSSAFGRASFSELL